MVYGAHHPAQRPQPRSGAYDDISSTAASGWLRITYNLTRAWVGACYTREQNRSDWDCYVTNPTATLLANSTVMLVFSVRARVYKDMYAAPLTRFLSHLGWDFFLLLYVRARLFLVCGAEKAAGWLRPGG